jgi:DNA sulfur modification protein DndB
MLPTKEFENFEAAAHKCSQFWEAVGEQIPEWEYVREGKMTAGEVRQEFIHSHSVVLQALGRVGRSIFQSENLELNKALYKLRDIDWSRKNIAVWDGRAMQAGRMSKSSQSTTLTSNEIKRVLGLTLSTEEQNVEDAFLAAQVARKAQN